jgi:AraC family transcriptional regulator
MMQLGKICMPGLGQKGDAAREGPMAQDYERRLRRVVDHIHDHTSGDLSLDALAEVAALSRFHFHRVYTAMVGETAANTVRRMRLHKAAVALVQGTDPLPVIAKRVGYPNPASFARAFSGHYGLTPAAFRNRGELRPFPLLITKKGPLMYPVTTRNDPERRLACVPHKGPYPEIGRAFEKLGSTAAARGLYGRFGKMVGVYYDSPADVKPAELRSHAGLEAPADLAIDPPLEEVRLPAGRHAVLTFTGPYAGLPAAYDQLMGVWLPASGEAPADSPMFEVYLNSPMDTAPENLVTEVCLPLK